MKKNKIFNMIEETLLEKELREIRDEIPEEVKFLSKNAFSGRKSKREPLQQNLIKYFELMSEISMIHVAAWMNKYYEVAATSKLKREAWFEFKKYSNLQLKALAAHYYLCKDEIIKDDIKNIFMEHDEWNSIIALDILKDTKLCFTIREKAAQVLIIDIKEIDQLRYLAENSQNKIIKDVAEKHKLIVESRWSYIYTISKIKK